MPVSLIKALLWIRQLIYSLYMKIALKALQKLLWGSRKKDKGDGEEEIFSAIEIFALYKTCT